MTTARFLELLPENGNNMQGPRVYGTKSGVSPHRRAGRLEVRQFGPIRGQHSLSPPITEEGREVRGATIAIWLYCYGAGCVINNKWYPK